MSREISSIIETGYSDIACELYDFVRSRGKLPTEETIMQILKESTDFNEIGNKLNQTFLECTKEALLSAVSQEYREKISAMLILEVNLHDDSTEDWFEIRFLDTTLDYVETDVLDDFYYSLQKYERDYLVNNLARNITFSLYASNQLIDSLLEIEGVNTFLYKTVIEPTDKRDYETYILHQGLIRQLWESQEASFEKLEQIHGLIRPYMGNLRREAVVHHFNAEFIVINVKVS